ncbi:MAG: TadE family protein [Acidobacteriaceae bacterium]|jgi:Flp pilus assembly protein TadG
MTAGDRNRPILRTKGKDLGPGEQGSALVEMSVSLSVLFTMFFCFMEICMAFYSQHMISESARDGARYAMVHGASCKTSTGSSCTATASQVNTYVSGLTWPNIAGGAVSPNTTYPDGDEAVGHHVQVVVTYTFNVSMPFVPNKSLTLTSTSKVPILQ